MDEEAEVPSEVPKATAGPSYDGIPEVGKPLIQPACPCGRLGSTSSWATRGPYPSMGYSDIVSWLCWPVGVGVGRRNLITAWTHSLPSSQPGPLLSARLTQA